MHHVNFSSIHSIYLHNEITHDYQTLRLIVETPRTISSTFEKMSFIWYKLRSMAALHESTVKLLVLAWFWAKLEFPFPDNEKSTLGIKPLFRGEWSHLTGKHLQSPRHQICREKCSEDYKLLGKELKMKWIKTVEKSKEWEPICRWYYPNKEK